VSGFVWLVGAGPGDPDLLTRRAARVLGEADLVLYDALVSPAALELAPRAQRFPVGKRAGRPSVDQETIHRLMINAARRGRRVVRLKGGDPFVCGRGGEEALALRAAGVPFEVVPGISSAVAAPAAAGIPVTHRGLASAFVVVSGHAENGYRPVLEALAPRSATVVVLMGLGTRDAIASVLLDRGWSASTPAAIVHGAFTDEQHAWTGTLGTLGEAVLPDTDAAGTIVIGAVVSLAATLRRAAPVAQEGGAYAVR
jgi:uroporphyrin-III C-methyltransferase / precorrin-2 dehydrogenase / sirohydrochlorin ferrochelatase